MKNKLLPAILLGALVGGLVSLIDRSTREKVLSGSKKAMNYAKHPDDLKDKFSSPSNEPSKLDQVKEEILFWKDTIEEIRRNNPELEQSIMDAKDTFMKNKEQKHLN